LFTNIFFRSPTEGQTTSAPTQFSNPDFSAPSYTAYPTPPVAPTSFPLADGASGRIEMNLFNLFSILIISFYFFIEFF
jgi:hypothetical protein